MTTPTNGGCKVDNTALPPRPTGPYHRNKAPTSTTEEKAATNTSTTTLPNSSSFLHKCCIDFHVTVKADEQALVHPAYLVKGLIVEMYAQDSSSILMSLDGKTQLPSLKHYPTANDNFRQYFDIKTVNKTVRMHEY